jgi:hypothetical protein
MIVVIAPVDTRGIARTTPTPTANTQKWIWLVLRLNPPLSNVHTHSTHVMLLLLQRRRRRTC